MKLSQAQIQQVQHQMESELIPETHPVADDLKQNFGDHTFFVDSSGLHILEPAESTEEEGQTAHVMMLASWSTDAEKTLVSHAPQSTGVVVKLDPEEPDPAN